MKYLFIYLLIINAVGWLFMLIDKKKAIHGLLRIPEKVLLGIGALGGSLGCILGMRLHHHKTKHIAFFAGLPMMLFLQVIVFIILYIKWI